MALLGVLLMEFGDFAMLRKMLRGIKARAESLSRTGQRGKHDEQDRAGGSRYFLPPHPRSQRCPG